MSQRINQHFGLLNKAIALSLGLIFLAQLGFAASSCPLMTPLDDSLGSIEWVDSNGERILIPISYCATSQSTDDAGETAEAAPEPCPLTSLQKALSDPTGALPELQAPLMGHASVSRAFNQSLHSNPASFYWANRGPPQTA